MNTNGNIYTVIYTTVVVVVVAAVLAFVSETLKPKQDANVKADAISQMLTASKFYEKSELDAMPSVMETEHVRVVRFARPLKIMMDGKRQEGAVLRP